MEKASNIPSLSPMFPWLMFLTPEDDKRPNYSKEEEIAEKKEDEVDAKFSGRTTFYSISRDGYYHITGGIGRETMKQGECLSCPQGWLLIHDPTSLNCCLLNPTTMHKFDLPSLHLECTLDECYNQLILSSPPIEQGCIVMLHDKRNHCFLYYQLGSSSSSSTWIFYDYLNHLDEDEKIIFIAASDNKRFYGCILGGKFIVIDFTPYFQIDIIEIGFSKRLPTWSQKKWLVATCNELFQIRSYHPMWMEKVLDIRVFSLDKVNDTWIRVKSIGDHRVFVLGTGIAGSCLAKEVGLKGDCIHLLEADGVSINVFDIKNGTLRSKRLCTHSSMSTLLIFPPL